MKLPIRLVLLFLLLRCFTQTATAQTVLLDSLALDTMPAFTSLDEAKKDPSKVIKLVLRKQRFKTVPPEIFSFPNLQYLDLGRNSLTELPDSIGKLKNLQVLHLSRNKIESLPSSIGNLLNLRVLDLNQNELTSLPASIGRLTKLVYLDLWSNNLTRFPEELSALSNNLKIVDLRVILINDETQKHVQALLPHTTIYFSPPCHCQY